MKRWLLLLLPMLLGGCERVNLPHGYVWRTTVPNESSITSPRGETMLSGPLNLWGRYPYVYGNGDRHGQHFALNLKTGELWCFLSGNEFSKFLARNELPYFYSPPSRTQGDAHQTSVYDIVYMKSSRSEEFIRNIQPPGKATR